MAKPGRTLTRDPMNGDRYQWRYWSSELGMWCDYGRAYETATEAINNIAADMGEEIEEEIGGEHGKA